jgi:putative transposase
MASNAARSGILGLPPFGFGGAAGPNPTDRAKRGTKRSLLVDGAGIPLAVAIDGANRNDCKLLAATLDAAAVARPDPERVEQHLCLDKGYDHRFVRGEAGARGYEHHIRARGEERAEPHPDGKARRWVMERTHSWLHRSRRLLVRREKKAENYLALLHLACAQLIFAKLGS